jgi:hypothetical protein
MVMRTRTPGAVAGGVEQRSAGCGFDSQLPARNAALVHAHRWLLLPWPVQHRPPGLLCPQSGLRGALLGIFIASCYCLLNFQCISVHVQECITFFLIPFCMFRLFECFLSVTEAVFFLQHCILDVFS